MTPETAVYLAKADQLLVEADATLKIELSDAREEPLTWRDFTPPKRSYRSGQVGR